MDLDDDFLGVLNKPGHANFCMRCLYGLPASASEVDTGRIGVGFYCLGSLDIIGLLEKKSKVTDRESWREWIWEQQISRRGVKALDSERRQAVEIDENDGRIGGFRPGPFMHTSFKAEASETIDPDPPHLIMTYTALIALAILRDDFSRLDREGLIGLLKATQQEDGSFTAIPGQGEADIRMVYTAFVISSLLDDWRGVDVPRALSFVRRCMSYEGGFGQAPGNEAQGGPTYCALATLALTPPSFSPIASLTPHERTRVIRWLAFRQSALDGGLSGRTEKGAADACYSFWCGGAMRILGVGRFVNRRMHALFLDWCQFAVVSVGGGGGSGGNDSGRGDEDGDEGGDGDEDEEKKKRKKERERRKRRKNERRLLGGIGKAKEEHPDPYHTYLALASLAMYSPVSDAYSEEEEEAAAGGGGGNESGEEEEEVDESWRLPRLDPLVNATEDTARWARAYVSGNRDL